MACGPSAFYTMPKKVQSSLAFLLGLLIYPKCSSLGWNDLEQLSNNLFERHERRRKRGTNVSSVSSRHLVASLLKPKVANSIDMQAIELSESGLGDLLPAKPKTKSSTNHKIDEHPLRTDEWELKFNKDPILQIIRHVDKSILRQNINQKSKQPTIIRFHRNGYCKLLRNPYCPEQETLSSSIEKSSSTLANVFPHIGSWHISHGTVYWTIPIWVTIPCDEHGEDENIYKLTTLHYSAELHVNKFGKRPKMFKGIVTRDRFDVKSKLNYRLVMTSFKGVGVGVDTLDLFYKDRKSGLGQ